MGAESKIAWTHSTFNPWWGCDKVSPGCKHCYAETWAKLTGHQVWGANGPRRRFKDGHWNEPLMWARKAAAAGERRRVFCASMADVFEEHPVAALERPRLWELITATPHLDWLLLTKRPENVARMVPWGQTWPRNVWMGVTVEDRERRARLDILRMLPAVVRFASMEPLLEDLELDPYKHLLGIDWCIVGGESGNRARNFDHTWAMKIFSAAEKAGATRFMKQMGSRPVAVVDGQVFPLHALQRHKKGEDPAEWPVELRVQDFPTPKLDRVAARA